MPPKTGYPVLHPWLLRQEEMWLGRLGLCRDHLAAKLTECRAWSRLEWFAWVVSTIVSTVQKVGWAWVAIVIVYAGVTSLVDIFEPLSRMPCMMTGGCDLVFRDDQGQLFLRAFIAMLPLWVLLFAWEVLIEKPYKRKNDDVQP